MAESDRIERLLAELTIDEAADLVSGMTLWLTHPVPRLGIPSLKMSDGPGGVRGESFGDGAPSRSFPCSAALASTWDTALVEQIGVELGKEARSKSVNVHLAPTVNTQRTPIGGRNFECFSEDPELSAGMAAAYVRGVQSQGIASTVKHFVGNDQEFERFTISCVIDERTLREIYLRPFEAACVEAGAWAVMAAYNKLNGTFCTEHSELLDQILRNDWGWDGTVVSDWRATHSTKESASAGLDIEMPGPPMSWGKVLAEAVKNGDVPEETLRTKARNVLALMERTGAFSERVPERYDDDPARDQLLRKVASAGMVLLKNETVGDSRILPLARDKEITLAVIGPAADEVAVQGGGSATVFPDHTITPMEGLQSGIGSAAKVLYEPGTLLSKRVPRLDMRRVRSQSGNQGFDLAFFANPQWDGTPVATTLARRSTLVWSRRPPGVGEGEWSVRASGSFTARASGSHRFRIAGSGRIRVFSNDQLFADQTPDAQGRTLIEKEIQLEEGTEYRLAFDLAPRAVGDFIALDVRLALPRSDDLLERAVSVASEADIAVVIVGLNDDLETEGRDRGTFELPEEQEELIRAVARVQERTVVAINAGSPIRMDWAEEVPAILMMWYPGQEAGDALADVLTGVVDASGRLPITIPKSMEDTPTASSYPGQDGEMRYEEGLFVGYRHYDLTGVTPRFPFGHGLSYTNFDYGSPKVNVEGDGGVSVAIEITNSGQKKGSEVVQLYVADVESSLLRPPKELKAFGKIELEPGETRKLTLNLGPRAFAYWDEDAHGWRVEEGEFELLLGSSSSEIRAKASVILKGEFLPVGPAGTR